MSELKNDGEAGVPEDEPQTEAGVAPDGGAQPDAPAQPPIDGGVMGAVPENASVGPIGVADGDEYPPEEQGR